MYDNDNITALEPISNTQINRGNLVQLRDKALGMHSAPSIFKIMSDTQLNFNVSL